MAKETEVTTPQKAIDLFKRRETAHAAKQKQLQSMIKSKIEEHLKNHFRPGGTSIFELQLSQHDENGITHETLEAVRRIYCDHGWECELEKPNHATTTGTTFKFSVKTKKK